MLWRVRCEEAVSKQAHEQSVTHCPWFRDPQGSGKELMQPVLDNQLKAASPLVLPAQVRVCVCVFVVCAWVCGQPLHLE